MHFVGNSKILQPLDVNLGTCKKCFQLGSAAPKAHLTAERQLQTQLL